MGGWKTWAGVGGLIVGAGLHVMGMDEMAQTAYVLSSGMVAVGLGHKLEKVLRQIATGATSAADHLAKKGPEKSQDH